jgi:beta-lactam-binding protein with PASTA domain
MLAVALVSAFIAMRLAIHGREAVVPPLTGLTVSEANSAAAHQGLHLTLENRFYSADVAAGRILAQDPAPGSRVRREWPVRITESLGTQRVNIPDLTGKSEREATINIRRLSLDLGAVAHLAIAADPDVVLTQTPPANSNGVDGPRVSLLVSDTDQSEPPAYVMPTLVGLSYAAATARAATAGLHLIATAETPPAATSPNPTPTSPAAAPPSSPTPSPAPNPPPSEPPPAPTTGTVVAQVPQAGRRVQQGEAVRVTLAHSVPDSATAPPQ